MNEDKPIQAAFSGLVSLMLLLAVFYIGYASVAALLVKYIFLDYFARIGWATDFSYLTVVMLLLLIKLVVSFATGSVKQSIKDSKLNS